MTRLGYQNLPERIEKLQAHVKTPRGRGDHTAWRRLAELAKYLKYRTTSVSFDEMLKTYYNLERSIPLYNTVHPLFSSLSKIKTDENCPRDHFYVYYEQELKAALAHADEQDAVAATMKFCPTEEEVAAHRRRDGHDTLPGMRRAEGDHTDGRDAARRLVVAVVADRDAQTPDETRDLRRIGEESMKIVDDEPAIKTGVASNAYRENWDRIFGEARKCTPDELAVDPTVDSDAIEITLRSYANLIVPLEAQIGPIEKPFPVSCEKCGRTIDEVNINWNDPREPLCVVCAR